MAAPDTLRLEILTPTKRVFEGEVLFMGLETTRGRIEVHPDHAAMVAVVGIGSVEVGLADGGGYGVAVHGGIMQIRPGVPERGETPGEPAHVQILAKEGEHPTEIDLPRAEEALTRAAAALLEAQETTDQRVFQARLRAEARIGAFKSFRHHSESQSQ